MFKPLNGKVAITPDEKQNETASGIILLDSQVEKPCTGTVLVGNDEVKAGERVLFSRFGFDETEIDGKTVYIVSTSCLLAIL